jgi:hypothetical protein
MMFLVDVFRDPAGVLLGVLFPRDQLLVDEGAGSFLDLAVGVGEGVRGRHGGTVQEETGEA